jgi:NDP-sugar pyrophosphorylase family protein
MNELGALVLAAGFGTRFGKLTKDTAKHFLPLDNRRIIDFALDDFTPDTDVYVNIKSHRNFGGLENHLKRHYSDVKILYEHVRYESNILLVFMEYIRHLGLLRHSDIIIRPGDVVSDPRYEKLDLGKALEFHRQNKSHLTLVSKTEWDDKSADIRGYSDTEFFRLAKEGRIQGIKRPYERHDGYTDSTHSGIYIVSNTIVPFIPYIILTRLLRKGSLPYTSEFFRRVRVFHYEQPGWQWIDIGTPEMYHLAQGIVSQKK